MAEQVQIDFTVDGAPAAKTLGELEQQAEQLNAALRGAELGSEEYKKLNQQLVETNRQVKNLELGFEALDNEQVASEIGSVAGAIGDVTGAMILLGGENETLQQMANNIQTAIGVSMAFKGAIEGFSSAFKLFNNIVRVNPFVLIGTAVALLIVGIIALIKNFDAVVDALVNVGQWVKKTIDGFGKWKNVILLMLGPIGWLIKAWDFFFGEQIKHLNEQERLAEEARLRRVEQQKEITAQHKERLDQIKEEAQAEQELFDDRQEIFDLDIARMEAEGKNSDALKKAKIEDQLEHEKFVLESINKQIESWTQYYEDLFVLSGKSREDFFKQMKGQGIDLEALQQEALDLVEEQNRKIFSAETKLIDFQRQLREKNAKEEVETVEETLQSIEELRNDFLARLEAAENEFLNSQLSKQVQEENAVREKYFTLIEEARQFGEDASILEEAQQQALTEITERYEQERLDAVKEAEEEKRAERQAAVEEAIKGAEELFSIAESLNSLASGREMKRIDAKIKAGQQLTKEEEKRLKRQDQIQKAFALAQIAADTARGVSGAIAAGAGIPFPANLGAIASGVAAVLAGAAQAAGIMGESVDIPSISADTASTGTDSTNNVPDVNDIALGSTYLNQPQQVYVVESDITNTQNKVAKIEQAATFS